jgi:succinate dehydrogenase hydrophobic anchor subunit
MAQQDYRQHRESLNRLLVSVSAVILLTCASLVVFFAYVQLPLLLASGVSIVLLLGGSLLCWRSFLASNIVLVLSLAAIEAALLGVQPGLLFPFLLIDLLVLSVLARFWRPPE